MRHLPLPSPHTDPDLFFDALAPPNKGHEELVLVAASGWTW
jgi:hypothetical protein